MDARIRQVMEFTACDSYTAHRLLEQHGGNEEHAINAIIADPSLMAQNTGQAAAPSWDDPPTYNDQQHGNQGQSLLPGPSSSSEAKVTTWAEATRADTRRRSPRNAEERRNSPIDLTADDDDEDLRKAMQASLESEKDRQKRNQWAPPRAPGQTANEEDEQLTRAIEASMLQSSAATRPQSPVLPESQLDLLGNTSLRQHDHPLAILAPSPNMHLFAAALQAMFAAEPLRKAFMGLRFVDVRLRITDSESNAMLDYWRGGSPAGLRKATAEQWRESGVDALNQDKLDILMRLNTLVAFMIFSKRQMCIAEDVVTFSPLAGNFAYSMNSDGKPAEQVIACFIDNDLSFLADIIAQNNSHSGSPDMDEILINFSTYTLSAEREEVTEVQAPIDPYDFSVHHLQRNAINTTVHRALYSRNAEEGMLYHKVGKTLLLSISNLRATPLGLTSDWDAERDKNAKFEIESRIFLDYFMWQRRRGKRLDLDTERVKKAIKRVEDLEKYKKSIATQNGEDSRMLLKNSIAYFRDACQDDNKDALRSAGIKEAVPRLESILADLEEEIDFAERQLANARLFVDELRDNKLAAFEKELAKAENQTMRYDLTAVIRSEEDTSSVHVRHRDETRQSASEAKWWRISEGRAHASTEAEATDGGTAPVFLVYTEHEGDNRASNEAGQQDTPDASDSMDRDDKPPKTVRIDSERNWWSNTPVVEAIERDNALFGSVLAQQMQSPSSITQKVPDLRKETSSDTPVTDVSMSSSPPPRQG